MEAYQGLEWTLQGNIVYNPSAIPVWFEAQGGGGYVVHPGETLAL